MRQFIAVVVGLVLCAAACAEEVAFEVAFADGFDPTTASVYRIGALALRDPHVFYSLGFCLDVTAQVNDQVQQQLDADQDGDGFFDSSALVVMKPRAIDAAPHVMETQDGVCTTAAPSQCSPGVGQAQSRWYEAFTVAAPVVCLGALVNTTSGYSPPVPGVDGTCFTTTPRDGTLPFGTLQIPLWDTQFGAPWPATSGTTGGGLMRGFLRETDADQISINFNGQDIVLSSALPDGTGSCSTNVANGKDFDRGEPGWWMYLEYRLDAVSASGF